MVLSATESFALGDGRPRMRRDNEVPSVETCGFIYGSRRTLPSSDEVFIHVDRFHESISARRAKDEVTPDANAIWLKNSIIERWSPHLSLLGDFHTHPYGSRNEAQLARGWEFSEADKTTFLGDDDLWELSENRPVMLVMVVAPMQRVHETEAEWLYYDVWVFNVGHLRFWLAATVGELDGDDRNFQKDVVLDLDPRFYNEPGGRLFGVD